MMDKQDGYEVWMEGYAATGESAGAEYYGSHEADNFQQACQKAMEEKGMNDDYYDAKNNTYWACRFFDNEVDARKTFG